MQITASLDSSVGRASDWRSEGPWFNPGSRQFVFAPICFCSIIWNISRMMCNLQQIIKNIIVIFVKHDHDGTRTHNLPIRSRTPYPLGHAAITDILSITCMHQRTSSQLVWQCQQSEYPGTSQSSWNWSVKKHYPSIAVTIQLTHVLLIHAFSGRMAERSKALV